jgi:hypothetical protein
VKFKRYLAHSRTAVQPVCGLFGVCKGGAGVG